MSTDQSRAIPSIAGFWRRLGAFLLDALLLGAVGLTAGLFLTPQFVQLGPRGRLLGFAVAWLYFSIGNSRLCGGQTLGKKLLKVKVIANDGALLSLPRSLVRFLPLGLPWFLNNAQLPESVLLSFWVYLFSILVFGLGLSVIYLYLFNRRSRQSLHDLLVGSYVVSAQSSGALETPPLWAGHLIVCGLVLAIAGLTPYIALNLAAREPFATLLEVVRGVNSEPWAVNARVDQGKTLTRSNQGNHTVAWMKITVYCRDSDIKNADRAKHVAKKALSIDSSAAGLDLIQVTLVYGYDIGIASLWRSQNNAYSPAQWVVQ